MVEQFGVQPVDSDHVPSDIHVRLLGVPEYPDAQVTVKVVLKAETPIEVVYPVASTGDPQSVQ